MATVGSDIDFYALLDLTENATESQVLSQLRKFARIHHPDKNPSSSAKEIFALGQVGRDLLLCPAKRQIYDSTRLERKNRERQNDLLVDKRRRMKDDLEARERGVKRAAEEGDDEKAARELRRLAEDGKRRRKEREAALKTDLTPETPKLRDGWLPPLNVSEYKSECSSAAASGHSPTAGLNAQACVPELDRTLIVKWPRAESNPISREELVELFSIFGEVQSADILNPAKKMHMGKGNKKRLATACMLRYASIDSAQKAMRESKNLEDPRWDMFDSINWASTKVPEFIDGDESNSNDIDSGPSTPARDETRTSAADPLKKMGSKPFTPAPPINGETLRKMPSFSSFSPLPKNGSPIERSLGIDISSLEDMTMIRLRNAEKQRMTNEMQRQEYGETAAATNDEKSQS